ncbi:398_t:CDS:2 [Funneliformis geosporum]|uniref:398_t:CDS:1 n=1 Tax=Funneliformis geosporum TaxID=1117311 RepID=A0A9W4X6F6_9GLOM|nr:398_t:CDS:2 [Funneliformis geosporum]
MWKKPKKENWLKIKEIFDHQRRTEVILLLCWDVPATEHSNKEDHEPCGIKKIDTPVTAKDIKLWKIEIPDNHDDELANFSLQDRDMLPALGLYSSHGIHNGILTLLGERTNP